MPDSRFTAKMSAMPHHPSGNGSHSDRSAAGTAKGFRRYRTLDAWRGLACILVVIYHSTMHVSHSAEPGESWWSRLGYLLLKLTETFSVGVPIFFVISGYCIMATLDASRRRAEGVGVYFRRRLRRIYPPYWAALAISSMVIWGTERYFWPGLFTRSVFRMTSPTSLNPGAWLGNLTLTESWRFHVAGGDVTYLLGHAWTLCYEEQFYAVTGLILLLAPRRMFLAAIMVTAGISLLSSWAGRNGISFEGTIVGWEWFYFAAGIAAYYRSHHADRVGRAVVLALLAAALFLPLIDSHRVLPVNSSLRFSWFIAMWCAFLIAAFHRYDEQMSSWRVLRPFSFCGRICYSLYLIHPLVTTGIGHAFIRWEMGGNWETLLVTLPVSFTLSLAAGSAFFFLIERHFVSYSHPSRTDAVSSAHRSVRPDGLPSPTRKLGELEPAAESAS